MRFSTYTLLSLTLFLFSCEKAEIPKPKLAVSGASIFTVSTGSDYRNQLFYDLENQQIVSSNDRAIWDLAFEADEAGFRILLNGSKLTKVAKTSATSMEAVTSSAGAIWLYDAPSGNLDSTAFADWRTSDQVYLLDLGMSVLGVELGQKKMKVLSVNESEYQIEFADLNGSNYKTASISKNTAASFVYFSLKTNQVVSVEPDKSKWDLCFTSYTHVYPDGMPYIVAGVLSNRNQVRIAAISKSFADIHFADYLASNFTNAINVIGFDWKAYNFDTAIYAVDPTKSFIVKSVSGRVFKLHFVDYYDGFGQKGAPTVELEELVG
jgi:hypothetical protein